MKKIPTIALIAFLPLGLGLSAESKNTDTETHPPLVKSVTPEYPAAALLLGEQGTVNVELLVSAEGEVIAVGTIDKTKHPALAQAAMKAIRKWKFESRTEVTDRPYMVKVPVNFTIADKGELLATQVAAK